MAATVLSHYRALGLPRRATSEDVRAAYLELAKKWHPDVNPGRNALRKFQRINDAYSALAEREAAPRRRARPAKRVKIRVPLNCSDCGKPTIEPRHARFTTIYSLILFSWRRESAGVFCSDCARRIGLKASALSGLLGWWSIPGLILTPLAVLRNARGGKRDEATNLNFLCHNLQAYEAAGDTEAARRLAYVIARSSNSVAVKINMSVAALIGGDEGLGREVSGEWARRAELGLLHAAAAAAVPTAVAIGLLA